MTTNIPRIFELNLSRLLVWVIALVRYFSMIFSYAERSWGQPGTEFSPAVSAMPAFIPGSHTWTIREEMKLLLQLPAPGPCSFLPLFLWHTDPFPHPWVTLTGFVFAHENFLKLTRDVLPSPTGEREPKQRGSAPASHCASPWQTPSPASNKNCSLPESPSLQNGFRKGESLS